VALSKPGGCTPSRLDALKSGTLRMVEAYSPSVPAHEYSAIDFTATARAYPCRTTTVKHSEGSHLSAATPPKTPELTASTRPMGPRSRVPANRVAKPRLSGRRELPDLVPRLERTKIRALGLLKGAWRAVNKTSDCWHDQADAISAAANKRRRAPRHQFPLDVFQTGSGTSP